MKIPNNPQMRTPCSRSPYGTQIKGTARSSQDTHIRSLPLAIEFRFVFFVPYERTMRSRGRLWLFSDKLLDMLDTLTQKGRMDDMISGINHITLSVKDVDESFHFYTQVLGAQPVAKWPKGVYLLAGDVWIALVLDSQTRNAPFPEYTHIAFTVPSDRFEQVSERIRRSGAEIWQENKSEGASLYFTDPNGHKLEIHDSDLKARIQSARENPWEGLAFFVEK